VKRVWLIARQEYIKYVTRRGFLISVMLFPVWIGLVAFLPGTLDRATPSRVFTVIDRAGGYETAIADEIARNDTAAMLSALSEYAHANADMAELRAGAPGVAGVLDKPDDEREVEAFRHSGGVPAMLAGMSRFLKPHAPPFVPPVPKFRLVAAPKELAEAFPDTFSNAARLYLSGGRTVPVNGTNSVLFAVIVLPKDFGANGNVAAQYWGTNLTDGELRGFLKQTLGDSLRWRAVHRLVPDEAAARAALGSSANIEQRNPALSGGGQVGFGDVVAS
jgi:ABC-2 type transport system permease protein